MMNRRLQALRSLSSGVAALALIVAQATHAREAARVKPRIEQRDGYTVAFVDADSKRVIDAILGAMLGLDYSVDPAITGNLTLRTSNPVQRDELIALLEGALRSINAALLIDGRNYRIVPLDVARTRAPMLAQSSETREPFDEAPLAPGFASEVFALKHASAREIGRMLEQVIGKEAVTLIDNAQNSVTVSGSAEERQAARDVVRRFDIDTLADMNFELYRLESVDPNSLLAELERIFQPPYDFIGSRVRVIPLPRLRSMLVIAGDRADITRLEPWIRRLDVGVSGKRKLYNYAVQNGRARDLASALQRVLGTSDSGGESPSEQAIPSGNADPNAASGSGDSQSGGERPSRGGTSEQSSSSKGTRIVPNEPTNSLLIYADGEEYSFIREAIEKLDQPVPQVLIEATLAEVTLGNDFRYGVNFQGVNGRTTVTNSSTGGGTPASSFPGFSVAIIGNDVAGVLNTLQSKTNVRVLSAPKIMVVNNQTATLQVGDQVPIITQQQQSVNSPGAPVVNTVELRDTGVILKVTPRVNESGTVTLDIDQEVSDVAQTTTSGINSPTIQQRRLTSTITTRTGQMVALGGLIRERVSRSRSGVPLLSQIPLIGGAFGSHSKNGGRTELIILLTPTVIRSPDEVKFVVDALIDGLDVSRPLVDRAIRTQVGGNPLPRPPAPQPPPPVKRKRR